MGLVPDRLHSPAIVAISFSLALSVPEPARSIDLTCGACWDHCARTTKSFARDWSEIGSKERHGRWVRQWQCYEEQCGACINGKYVRYTGGYQIEDPANPGVHVHPLPHIYGTGGFSPPDIREGDVYLDGKLAKRVTPNRAWWRPYIRFRVCSVEPTECRRNACVEFAKHKEECGGLEDQVDCVVSGEIRLLAMSRACVAKGEAGVIRIETAEEAAEHRRMHKGLPGEGSMLGKVPFHGSKGGTEIVE